MEKKDKPMKPSKKKFFSKKNIFIIIGALFIVAMGSGFGMLKASENPSFCGLCHNMSDYVESYEEGNLLAKPHADEGVGCLDCHEETIPEKIKKGVKFITKDYETPFEKRDFGTRQFCLECHEDPDKVEKLFEEVVAETDYPDGSNPHDNHNGDLSCNVCHNVHQKSEVFCLQCHVHRDFMNDLDVESWILE